MKSFHVDLPMAGIIGVDVEAETEKEAIEKAMKIPWRLTIYTLSIYTDKDYKGPYPEIVEVDVFKRLCEGNVCRAPLHEASAEEE